MIKTEKLRKRVKYKAVDKRSYFRKVKLKKYKNNYLKRKNTYKGI